MNNNPIIIDITIFTEIVNTLDVAASQKLLRKTNISKKDQISDKYLDYLNDIIDSVCNSIEYYHFPILNEYASGKGYPYYITFQPITESRELLTPIELGFRISNHRNKLAERSSSSSRVRIIRLTLAEEPYTSSLELIDRAAEICERLYHGDLTVLDEIF